jgi:hypothetical protein
MTIRREASRLGLMMSLEEMESLKASMENFSSTKMERKESYDDSYR